MFGPNSSVRVFPPFYTAFGKLTKIGKNVFINFGCTFLDQGSITIEDDVFIAPGVKITTEAHPENPEERHNLLIKPVAIKQNAWIGANAVMLVHGQNAHSRYFSEDAFKKLKGENKKLLIVPNANHTDLYDNLEKIPFDEIENFIRTNLK